MAENSKASSGRCLRQPSDIHWEAHAEALVPGFPDERFPGRINFCLPVPTVGVFILCSIKWRVFVALLSELAGVTVNRESNNYCPSALLEAATFDSGTPHPRASFCCCCCCRQNHRLRILPSFMFPWTIYSEETSVSLKNQSPR